MHIIGLGALEGSVCSVASPVSGLKYQCYQGQCVDSSTINIPTIIQINPCLPNPCQNGGVCVSDSTTVSSFSCQCPSDRSFSGKYFLTNSSTFI